MKRLQTKYKLLIVCLISVILSSAQEPGMISINSKPPGARVVLNGEDTKRTTPFQRALTPGEYSFQLQLEDHRDYSGEFQIKESDIRVINADMIPLFSIVEITTSPDGAEVIIDGRKKGRTPLTLKEIPTGSHSIQITKDPYEDIETTFSNEDGKHTHLNFELVSTLAILGIVAYPDAEIFIDGERVANRIYTDHLEEGEYTIRVEKEGYVSEEKVVTINKGEDKNLQFELEKIKSNLSVTSEPSAAKVFINDELLGETPLVIKSLDIGEYEIKLTKGDFEPWLEKVTVKSDELTEIEAVLKWGETIEVASDPPGAVLYVDNERIGITPQELLLKKGNHHFRFTKFGYEDYEAVYKISKSEEIEVGLEVKEFPLNVKTDPPRAKVFVNDKLQGKTPLAGSVDFGNADIQISKRGYKKIYDEYLVENNPLVLEYNLEPDKVRKKSEAILYSLLLPGAGQSYLSRKVTPYLLGVAAAGCLAGYLYFNTEAANIHQEYLNETSDINRRERLKGEWEQQYEISQGFLFGTIGIYAVNLIWVAIMKDDNKKLDKIGFKAGINREFKTPEIGLTLKL